MTVRAIVALDEAGTLDVPQAGDTYSCPTDLELGGKIVSASNADIDIEPNGTGNVLLGNYTFDADQTVGAGQDNYILTYDHAGAKISLEAPAVGAGDLKADGTVPLTANWDVGAYKITAAQLASDIATGTAPLVVASTTAVTNLNADLLDGNHAAAFATASQGSLADTSLQSVSEDSLPQLGGPLDVNGRKIISALNGNIDIEPNGTGDVLLGNFTFDADQTVGAGQDNYVMTYDHAGGKISLEAATGSVATDAIWDAAGDIVQGTGANTAARLAIGTANQLLRVNAGATALEYYTPAAAGDFKADGSVDMTGEFRTDVGTFDSDVANGASAVAFSYDTAVSYSTTGAKLASWKNNTAEKAYITYAGGLQLISGATTAPHAQSVNLQLSASGTQASSGQYSAIIGGSANTASATHSIAGGNANAVSGQHSVGLGYQNTVSQNYAYAIGASCTNAQTQSLAIGHYGQPRFPDSLAIGGGTTTFSGPRCQALLGTLYKETTDATPVEMLIDTGRLVMAADSSWGFMVMVVARSNEADGNDSAAYKLEGLIARDESNNTALVGTVTKTVIAESAGATTWDADALADNTNEALQISVTGEASTTIRWAATVYITEIILP